MPRPTMAARRIKEGLRPKEGLALSDIAVSPSVADRTLDREGKSRPRRDGGA